jgi:hypothetical protein
VGKLILMRSLYRLGEPVIGLLDFSEATMNVLQVSFYPCRSIVLPEIFKNNEKIL